MTESNDRTEDPTEQGEILPSAKRENAPPARGENILALISAHTERPDLFPETVERHDPGFIKRLTEGAEASSKKFRDARFHFGKHQAYTSLAVSGAAALLILYFVWIVVERGSSVFWPVVSLAMLYAVTQGGRNGFLSIAKGIADLIRRQGKSGEKD